MIGILKWLTRWGAGEVVSVSTPVYLGELTLTKNTKTTLSITKTVARTTQLTKTIQRELKV